jgi:hypothetical protein
MSLSNPPKDTPKVEPPKDEELREDLRQIFSGTMAIVQEEDLDKALALIKLQQEALLSKLEAELPDRKIGTEKIPLNDIERGYNVAAEDVRQVVNKLRLEL